jgi:hypothetical protein
MRLLILAVAVLALAACDQASFRKGLDDARDDINGK